jgi:hypothetical protein
MRDTDIIIQVQSQTPFQELEFPYFIGRKGGQSKVEPTFNRLFKSNFEGPDRGLVTLNEIL